MGVVCVERLRGVASVGLGLGKGSLPDHLQTMTYHVRQRLSTRLDPGVNTTGALALGLSPSS